MFIQECGFSDFGESDIDSKLQMFRDNVHLVDSNRLGTVPIRLIKPQGLSSGQPEWLWNPYTAVGSC